MALTFYYGSGLPFAWKVWLILEHKGIPYEFRLLEPAQLQSRIGPQARIFSQR